MDSILHTKPLFVIQRSAGIFFYHNFISIGWTYKLTFFHKQPATSSRLTFGTFPDGYVVIYTLQNQFLIVWLANDVQLELLYPKLQSMLDQRLCMLASFLQKKYIL